MVRRRRRAVFLDRDGVLVRSLVRSGKAYAPRRLADFRLLPHARRSVEGLREAGYLVIVVTNQPDIGNGIVPARVVEAMHDRLRERVPVDDVLMCPHSQDAGCACRKPKPGLLLDAAERYGIDLSRSVMVGDRASDVAAGRSAGCRTIFIDRGYAESSPVGQDATARSLRGATTHILGMTMMKSKGA